MKILSLRRSFNADHSASDYQYVTWDPREDVARKGKLGISAKRIEVEFDDPDERAALLIGASLLRKLKRKGGTLVPGKALDRVIAKLTESFAEGAARKIEDETERIMDWLESGRVETDSSYYQDFWFEAPEHTYSAKDKIPLIQRAIEEGFDLVMEYWTRSRGEFSTRRITPKSLDGKMLQAYCHLRKAERVFKVSRIKSIERASDETEKE